MGVIGAVRGIETLSERVESLSREGSAAVADTTWECPRGRRAADQVTELAAIAHAIGRDLREIGTRLRVELLG